MAQPLLPLPDDLTSDERRQLLDVIYPEVARLRRIDLIPEAIQAQLGRSYNPELVALAISLVQRAAKQTVELRDPIAVGGRRDPWYAGPQPGDRCWPGLVQLLKERGWAKEDIDSLDASSSRIVAALRPPHGSSFRVKGLVVGYVQSGKTASYTSVISKAADAGYKLFIIIAGMTERLRRQTQERLLRELAHVERDRWITLTSAQFDFSQQAQEINAQAALGAHNDNRYLVVVKKNGPRLRRLLDWLKAAPDQVKNCPTLLIDDEADEASINTARQEAVRTRINGLIRDLIAALPKSAYVAYTATPFANLLIPPGNQDRHSFDDLYPSNFIIDLPRPASYFGAERVFGRDALRGEDDAESSGMDIVRRIPDADAAAMKVPSRERRHEYTPPAAASLSECLRYFVVACATRRARGQGDQHMTMLAHTSQYTATHSRLQTHLQQMLERLREELASNAETLLLELKQQWAGEMERCGADGNARAGVAWSMVKREVPAVLHDMTVVKENGRASELDFTSGPVTAIVVGGNVLSRGLTIEGLTVSYFLRTTSMYDTLMQMGRWFGYRAGYEDLCRLWVTADVAKAFYDLATVEEEIRRDIRRYAEEGLTPEEFGVRIRTHPSLLVTSKLKMQHAVTASIGYGGREVSTRVFAVDDAEVLAKAWQAGVRLLERAAVDSQRDASRADAHIVYRGVTADKILEFLSEYPVHDRCEEFRPVLLTQYIQKQLNAERPRLVMWNVILVQPSVGQRSRFAFGGLGEVKLVNRSRLAAVPDSEGWADIRALTTEGDAAIDMDGSAASLGRAAILSARSAQAPDIGLLLLYPIDPNSTPQAQAKDRAPLNAQHPVLGAAMVIPSPTGPEEREAEYVTANLTLIQQYAIDDIEEEQFDETEDGVVVVD